MSTFRFLVVFALGLSCADAVRLERPESVAQASRIPGGKAPTKRDARVTLYMSTNVLATQELCDACVAAEDDLITNQTAEMAAQSNLTAAEVVLNTKTSLHETCLTQEVTATVATSNAKEAVQAQLTATQLPVTADDPPQAYATGSTVHTPEGTNLLVYLLDEWNAAKAHLSAKSAECAVKLVEKEQAAEVVATKTSILNSATAAVAAARADATTACDAMRAGGYGASPRAPPAAPPSGCASGVTAVDFAPRVAGCDGAWSTPGILSAGAQALCASGWHVCDGANEVAQLGMSGCPAFSTITFYSTAQSSLGYWNCGDVGNNDIWGCGSAGQSSSCGPLNRALGQDASIFGLDSWTVGADSNLDGEKNGVTKAEGQGGVMCCKI